jgi:chemotaxis protein CheX
MNLLYGDALVEVLQRVFKSIFDVDVQLVQRRTEEGKEAPFEVSGIIGITGPTRGSIVISFPMSLARKLTALMLKEGQPNKVTAQDISDSIGELANIVAGNLLVMLDEKVAEKSHISLPNVVMGLHRIVWSSKDVPCDLLVFETEMGMLAAETSLRETPDSWRQ